MQFTGEKYGEKIEWIATKALVEGHFDAVSVDPTDPVYGPTAQTRRWNPRSRCDPHKEMELVQQLRQRVSTAERLHALDGLAVDQTAADKISRYKQCTPAWYRSREMRLTASCFAAAVGANPYADRLQMCLSKAWPNTVKKTPPMVRGSQVERIIVHEALERLCIDHKVTQPASLSFPGLVIRPDLYYLGASPDGVVQFREDDKPALVGERCDLTA